MTKLALVCKDLAPHVDRVLYETVTIYDLNKEYFLDAEDASLPSTGMLTNPKFTLTRHVRFLVRPKPAMWIAAEFQAARIGFPAVVRVLVTRAASLETLE